MDQVYLYFILAVKIKIPEMSDGKNKMNIWNIQKKFK